MARGRDLVSELIEHFRPRADERDARLGTGPSESRVLREKAIAGVDCIHSHVPRNPNHATDVEVCANRLACFPDAICFVGLEAMESEAILVGVERDGADAEFVSRPKHADRDLASIGNEQLLEWGVRHGLRNLIRREPSLVLGISLHPATPEVRHFS